jgi:hypothetical protein
MVRLRPDGSLEIRTVSWREVLGRGDLGLIGGLAAAWAVGTALQRTALACPRLPTGALTLVLLRTIWVSGTAWLATALLGRVGTLR